MPTVLGVRVSHLQNPGLGRPIGPQRLLVADALERAHADEVDLTPSITHPTQLIR